ncbi:MAG: hypothetical protein E7359_00515 [Clostridiales bacterium]|nr:hypothetical protein [Clostridiales bacterium]
MIEINEKITICDKCKQKNKNYQIILNKKKIFLCNDCLNLLYKSIGKFVVPKSPQSILKKDNKIKYERF